MGLWRPLLSLDRSLSGFGLIEVVNWFDRFVDHMPPSDTVAAYVGLTLGYPHLFRLSFSR